MNTRKTRKAIKRMYESRRMWDFYSSKKFSKCWRRNLKKRCAEKNKQLEAEGRQYRFAPYFVCPFTTTVGNWPGIYKSVVTKYAKKLVNNKFYAVFKIDDNVLLWTDDNSQKK